MFLYTNQLPIRPEIELLLYSFDLQLCKSCVKSLDQIPTIRDIVVYLGFLNIHNLCAGGD